VKTNPILEEVWLLLKLKTLSQPSSQALPINDIPAQPLPSAKVGFVRIVTCTTIPEADRVVKELKSAGISAVIENKLEAVSNLYADLKNAYPYIRIRISSKDYDAARKLLTKQRHL
jgi:Putative prokaryotic signal transducing protein